jgi:HK97 family phage prohead protease
MGHALTPELRSLSLADAAAEIRTIDGGEQRFFGHAAVFDTRTSIGNPLRWGFYEEVAPGAFTKTLSEGDARMLIDHDSYYVVSRVSAGSLYLAQDSRGLATDSALDDDLSYVKDLKANLRNKNITGMSFGFYVVKDDWSTETVTTSDGNSAEVEIRRILEVRLIEVSAVTFPAYEDTDAGLRHVERALLARGDREAIARRAEHKPELRKLLEQLPAERADLEVSEVDGQERITVGDADTTQTPSDEPGETTRTEDGTDSTTEPAASTPNRPSEHELAAARLRALRARIRRPAA